MKVMEAAFNFTDAVIENKLFFIEQGFCPDTLTAKVKISGGTTLIAFYLTGIGTLNEVLPIREVHLQGLKEAFLQYDKDLKAAEQREKELKEEFEAWRAKNGK